jgi:hypothetical protein
MMSGLLALAVASVRWWTCLYTCGLHRSVAARRRAEIESDLWELLHDPTSGHSLTKAAHVFARLGAGVADDLCWRVEQAPIGPPAPRTVRVITAAVFLLTVLWVIPLSSGK